MIKHWQKRNIGCRSVHQFVNGTDAGTPHSVARHVNSTSHLM